MIYIHSSTRVGSTWLWSCFRRNPVTLAFCEPFNLQLATLRPEEVPNLNHATWHSKHPTGAAYFLEFVPLLRPEGGVRGFERSMAYEGFMPRDNRLTEAEVAYLNSLVVQAKALQRVPVVADAVSLGRMAAIKAEFDGLHLLLYRSVFRQWCSYTEQWLHGNAGFIANNRLILDASPHDPVLADIARLFPFNGTCARDPNAFFAHAFIHIYLYARAADHADLVLDLDELASSPEARAAAETSIQELSKVAVDLSGPRTSMTYALVDAGSPELLREMANALALPGRSASTQAGAAFAERVTETLIEDYARWRAIAGPLVQEVAAPGGVWDRYAEAEAARVALAASECAARAEVEVHRTARAEAEATAEEVHMARVELAEARAMQAEAERRAALLQAEIAALRQSTSWRCTALLRRAVQNVRLARQRARILKGSVAQVRHQVAPDRAV